VARAYRAIVGEEEVYLFEQQVGESDAKHKGGIWISAMDQKVRPKTASAAK